MQRRSQGSREIINKATHLQEPVSSTTWWDTEAEEGERPEGEEERDAEKDSSVTYHTSTVFSTGNQRGRGAGTGALKPPGMETGLPLIYSPLLNSSAQQSQPAPLNSLGGKIYGQRLLAVKRATHRARQEVSPIKSGLGFTSEREAFSQEEGGWKEANSYPPRQW